MDRARDWATRLTHEASQHAASCFVTLTFSDAHLPDDYSVSVRDTQLFMKRLRKRHGKAIRFFACGEYGDTNSRPHYHFALFGVDFSSDRYLWRRTPSGHLQYRSRALEELWPYGNSEIGSLTVQSAGYIARYITKKITGKLADTHYRRLHPLTGELVQVRPEFVVMSRRPGIGASWLGKYKCDAFPSDFVVIEGQKRPVPRYYLNALQEDERDSVILKRLAKGQAHAQDRTPDRLAVREEVQAIRLDKLKREL
jgi:hypothetical protein